jgi:hypothetical protein
LDHANKYDISKKFIKKKQLVSKYKSNTCQNHKYIIFYTKTYLFWLSFFVVDRWNDGSHYESTHINEGVDIRTPITIFELVIWLLWTKIEFFKNKIGFNILILTIGFTDKYLMLIEMQFRIS